MPERHTFQVQGMDCANESRVIDAALRACPGVAAVDFDLLRQRLTVHYDAERVGISALRDAIVRSGFTPAPEGFPEAEARDLGGVLRGQVLLAAVSAALFLCGLAAASGWLPAFPGWPESLPSRILFGLSMILSMRHFVPRAWTALKQRHADMNVLVSVAAAGALLLGDWAEGALVSLLFAAAHLMETASSARVRKSIERFLALMPVTAERLSGEGVTETVPVHQLRVGDMVLVKPGVRLPADGVVETGASFVDQSALTGEAIPLSVQCGDCVFAGSTNGNGTLRVRVSRDASHSRAARLEETIHEAQLLRSPTERWVERFARVYTPVVIALAAAVAVVPPLIGYDWREWFYHALVMLLIACPCALVISTPVTMVSAITALARRGVLVRGGESIERAVAVRAVAFDKTGVLTTGDLQVRRMAVVGAVDELQALVRAAAIEALSEHPVARAVLSHAEAIATLHGTAIPVADDFQAIPGLGGAGMVDGVSVWVGSPGLARKFGAWNSQAEHLAVELAGERGALVAAGSGKQLWFLAALSDTPRQAAAEAMATLSSMGMARLAMLSGDHPANCEAVARAAGIREVRASLMPEDKLAALREIEASTGPVAMVGDGINDAPAMAAASFSIAAGQRASDVTLQAADAIIWDGDLRRVPFLLAHSRKAMRIVRQNVVLAVGSKALFVLLAMLGVATLWMAVLADVGATLLVTANGLRLLKIPQGRAMETSSAVVVPSTSS